MVRDPMNTPVLPSAYTRRKLTERREVYATQKKSGRVVLEVSFPPLERGPSVPVPQDLLSSCDRGSLQDHESAHATRGACSAGSRAVSSPQTGWSDAVSTLQLGLRPSHDAPSPPHPAPGSRCTPLSLARSERRFPDETQERERGLRGRASGVALPSLGQLHMRASSLDACSK